MKKIEIEVYSQDSNMGVVRMPGRKFPGVVMQGDSLSILVNLANSILDRTMIIGDNELADNAQELKYLLAGRLRHYEIALQQNGIDLPYVSKLSKMHIQDKFISYIGTPYIHDAIIKQVRYTNSRVIVELQSYEKKLFAIEFTEVESVISNKPEGMILYSVSEMFSEEDTIRRFVFVNWDEENDSVLEIMAKDFVIHESK